MVGDIMLVIQKEQYLKSKKGISPPQGTILNGFHHVPYGIW